MVEATETLRKLSEKASKLNKSTDEINEIISAYEDQLAGMNIGIEVWLNDPEEGPFHSVEETSYSHGGLGTWTGESFCLRVEDRRRDKETNHRMAFIHVLGYCKIGDAWRIAVKRGWATTIGMSEEASWDWEETQTRYPLLEANRNMRLKALGAMDQLFKLIDEKLNEMLKAIENGKKHIKAVD